CDAQSIVRGPAQVTLGVNRTGQMVVQVAALRHLREKCEEERGIVADGREVRRGCAFARRRWRRRRGDGARGQHGHRRRPQRLPDHRTRVPGSGGFSNETTVGLPPSGLAARTIPFDSIPISFAGFRLKTITTVLPMSASGSYASAMPATSVRCSVPTSTVSFSSFFDFSTFSAVSTFAVR